MTKIVLWRVSKVSCDGGRIGNRWLEEFYQYEHIAKEKMLEKVDSSNSFELARTDSFIKFEIESCRKAGKPWSRLYKQDIVDDINGWCNWCYGMMIYVDYIEVDIDINQRIKELQKALAESMFCRHFTTSKCINYDSAGSTYQVDWTKQFKEWAKLADVDLSKHNPTAYDI